MRTITDNPEVVFIGTSVTESAIDPARIALDSGGTSYNAALPFSTPLSDEAWLEQMVLPELSPRFVVIGVLGATISGTDDILIDPLKLALARDRERPWWEASSLLARRGQLRDLEQMLTRSATISSGLLTQRGHQTGYYDRASPGAQPQGPRADSMSVDGQMIAAIEAMVELSRQATAQPVLLLEPGGCPPIYEDCLQSDEIDELLRDVARSMDVPIIDGRAIAWPDEYFADSAHFNESGTRAFSAFVSDELNALMGDVDRA